MQQETHSSTENGEPSALDSPNSWVNEVLEPDQLTASKMRYGRRKLSRGTLILLWTLRAYVVFMVFIVSLAIWNAVHSGS
jgi:hypothetical protein